MADALMKQYKNILFWKKKPSALKHTTRKKWNKMSYYHTWKLSNQTSSQAIYNLIWR